MSWLQLHINATKQSAECYEETLLSIGALSVTLTDQKNQPLLEPKVGETPVWDAVIVTGLFSQGTNQKTVLDALMEKRPEDTIDHHFEELLDQNWERSWLKDFKPMQFGETLWICPSWLIPPDPNATNISLDPGLAFGTGTHQTTSLCLKWLASAELTGKVVIDYGCGSGVLGIAAALLGAKKVIAIDNDPQALAATRDNAEKNQLGPDVLLTALSDDHEKILALTQTENGMNIGADLIIANILAGPLIELAPNIVNLMKPRAQLVLSGILIDQEKAVQSAYQGTIQFAPTTYLDEWVCLAGHTAITGITDNEQNSR